MTRFTLLLAAPLLLCARLAAGQEHDHSGAPPAHLGRVAFPTSCKRESQHQFERGVALLHSFWYEEATRTFRQVAQADSTCAMAYWGIASSSLHPLWAPPTPAELQTGAAAAAAAQALRAPTAREQGYVDAIAAFYTDAATVPHGQRLRRWSDALGRLHQAQPADGEAAAFYALSLVAVAAVSPPDTTYALQRQAADILEPLFRRAPGHPGLAHYLIHTYDTPGLAHLGAHAADRYASIAPSVPHALHMPSHIYIRLGMWDQAIASNVKSAAAARSYEVAQHLGGIWDQRMHAMDYLAYAYLQEGRDRSAKLVVDEANAVTRYVPDHSLSSEYALAAIPARYALERDQWHEAAALTMRTGMQPQAEAVTRFARAIGAARAGDTALARTEVAALVTIDQDLNSRHVPLWGAMVRAQRLAAEAWLAMAVGDREGAARLAGEASDLEDRSPTNPVTPGAILPARELLGDLLIEMGRAAEARTAYDAALAQQPRRARSLAGAARAAALAGDTAAAARYRRDLRLLLRKADAERREMAMR
ncbi:MAG: hypothetical protein ACHQX4_09975 [Gemmatimonadales bacterium]